MTRVVVADDQELVRSGFSLILQRAGLEVVGEAADGIEALAVSRSCRPEVVLMDVRMPRLDGIEATRQLVAAQPDVRVLALTTFDLDESGTRPSGPARAGSCSRTSRRRTSCTQSAWSHAGRCCSLPR